jgi:hypothetical protein
MKTYPRYTHPFFAHWLDASGHLAFPCYCTLAQ